MTQAKTDIDEIIRTGRPRRPVWRVLWVLLLLALGAGAWLWWAGRSGEGGRRYETVEAALAPIVVTVTATGTVEPTNLVEVSSELSGTIREVLVDFNSEVKAGQELARLDTDKLEAALEHARATLAAREAQVAVAEATLKEAQDSYERMVALDQRGVVSLQDFRAAEAAYARAQAELKSAEAAQRVAEADLKVEEANLAKACICSPIDGVVLDLDADPGQTVASSLQAPVLFTIAEDLRRMELRVDIDEADIGKVELGDPAVFTVEAYQNRSFPAEISELRYASETVEGVVTYKAILTIDNSALLLRPGMTATADITVARIDEALTVSNAALRFAPPVETDEDEEGGRGLLGLLFQRRPRPTSTRSAASADGWRTLWVLREGEMRPVEVRSGETDGMATEIVEGDLAPGDRVIVDIVTE